MIKENFKAIVDYTSVAWKGFFSDEEKQDYTEVFYEDYLWSLENGTLSDNLVSLCEMMLEDLHSSKDVTLRNFKEIIEKWLVEIMQYDDDRQCLLVTENNKRIEEIYPNTDEMFKAILVHMRNEKCKIQACRVDQAYLLYDF